MVYDPSDDYDRERMLLTTEGEYQGYALRAHCSPDTEGLTYIDNGVDELGNAPEREKYGAPFRVDIVFLNDVYPTTEELDNIRDELGSVFDAQFTGKIDSIYEMLEESDDSFEEIGELDPDEL